MDREYKNYANKRFPLNVRNMPPLICPFWTDVDTTEGGEVWSRVSNESSLLQRASLEGNQF